MREIVLDSETTGLDPENDKIIEIGAVEVWNFVRTGRTYHQYINPLKEVSAGAFKVHGLSNDFLKDKPPFHKVVDSFLEFIGNAPLVAQNAPFDIAFLNNELRRLRRPGLTNLVVDTLPLAREVKKGGYHNLDALCKFFKIDNSKRDKHGALLDAEILSEVYLALRGGRQFGMELALVGRDTAWTRPDYGPREFVPRITEAELTAHLAFIAGIKNSIWSTYAVHELAEAA